MNGNSSKDGGNIELSISMPATSFTIDQTTKTNPQQLQRRRPEANQSSSAAEPRDLNSIIHLMPPLSIERETKRLILAKKLDRETLDSYGAPSSQGSNLNGLNPSASSSASLTVHVKCQLRGESVNSNGANSIVIPIHLIVTDDNDNWPTFINSPYIIDLNESAQVGSLLAGNDIVAIDADQQGPFSTIEYSIVNGNLYSDSFAFLNPLDARSLVVKDSQLLDYESQSKLSLRIMAKDQGDPANWAIASLYLNLLDIDDRNPEFSDDKYAGVIRDNKPGEQIDLLPRRLVARDSDKTLDTPIFYSFHTKTNQSIHFELDRDLGKLSLKKSLPDLATPFCLLIRAAQLDNPQRYSIAQVSLQLSSSSQVQTFAARNNFGPKFLHSNFTVEIAESAPPGFTVLNIRTLLTGSNGFDSSLTFHLLDDETDSFNLDQKGTRLILNKSLDYEMYRHLSVRVLLTYEFNGQEMDAPVLVSGRRSNASNQLYPTLTCDTIRININIINQNEFAPEFSHDLYNFRLSIGDLIASFNSAENRTVKTSQANEVQPIDDSLGYRAFLIGQIHCSDRDFNDKISIQLSGNKANLFQLTPEGRLYLPLVNLSSQIGSSQASNMRKDGTSNKDNSNSWFPTSWVFGSPSAQVNPRANQQLYRRHDFGLSPESTSPLDRNYLNFLLSEFSSLGLLRLKVHATDDGRPQSLKSSSLIVISFISVDNFIIQQAQKMSQEKLAQQIGGDLNSGDIPTNSKTSQVMMIQANNGRSFVPVNSDIFTNLISSVNQTENENLKASESILRPKFEIPSDHSDSFGAPKMPPSLLLVDGDGAKFITMPAAIERAVSQHVNLQRESSNRQIFERKQQQNLIHVERNADTESGMAWVFTDFLHLFVYQSLWGFALHLAILVLIVILISTLRRYKQRSEASRNRSDFFDPSLNSTWLDGFTSILICGKSKSSPRGSSNLPDAPVSRTNGIYTNMGTSSRTTSDSSDLGSSYAFLAAAVKECQNPLITAYKSASTQQAKRQYSSSDISSSEDSEKSTTSSHEKIRELKVFSTNTVQQQTMNLREFDHNSNSESKYGHLRLTMNKMLDKAKDGKSDDPNNASHIENLVSKRINCDRDSPNDGKQLKSSTFVGSSGPSSAQSNISKPKSPTLVSVVNVSTGTNPRDNLNGSSSSIDSSSLSNISLRIKEAVDAGSDPELRQNSISQGEDTSIDSATLFNTERGQRQVRPLPSTPKTPKSSTPVNESVNEEALIGSPSQRRPLPQNPVHLKLKQQAILSQSQVNAGVSSSVRQFGQLRARPVAPPSPPQPNLNPDPDQNGNSAKPVSPATSVDRGYESFQSTSSNAFQTNPQRQVGVPKVPPPPPPPPQLGLVGFEGKVRQTKRQLETRQAESNLQQTSRFPTAAGVARARGSGASKSRSQTKCPETVLVGGTRFRSRTLKTNSDGRASDKLNCENMVEIGDAEETEDDDFHYSQSSRRSQSGDLILSDYASHRYVTSSNNNQQIDQLERELMIITRVAAEEQQRQHISAIQLLNQNPTDLIFDDDSCDVHFSNTLRSRPQEQRHHHHHHHHHHHRKSRQLSVACDRHHSRTMTNSKKHLTWSDQVGML